MGLDYYLFSLDPLHFYMLSYNIFRDYFATKNGIRNIYGVVCAC